MNPEHRSAILAGLLLVLLVCPAGATAPDIARFSTATTGQPPAGWVLETIRGRPPTRYRVVEQQGRRVLEAQAESATAGLSFPVRYEAGRWPRLRWQWRIDEHLAGTDMRRRAGDDFAARVYVSFDYDVGKLPLLTRIKLRVARLLYGTRVPGATLCYVWDPALPVDSILANAYSDRVQTVVVRSGAAGLGLWQIETRDISADFRNAFGEEAPPVTGITLATDTDDTGASAIAYFGDVEALPPLP